MRKARYNVLAILMMACVSWFMQDHLLIQHRSLGFSGFAGPTISDNGATSAVNASDWFDRETWEENKNQHRCFYVENICHSSQGLFYDDKVSNVSTTKSPRQPPLNLDVNHAWPSGYPASVTVESRELVDPQHQLTCHYSLIPNHLVLHTVYDMLGEFYVRVLMGFAELVETFENNLENFLVQTQVYLHTKDLNKPLLDSHFLFLDIFLSNPLQSFKSLMDLNACRCLRRLILCGYGEEVTENETHLSFVGHDGRVGKRGYGLSVRPGGSQKPLPQYQKLRESLKGRMIDSHPFIREKIKEMRESLLQIFQVTGPSEDWRIVGLMQRQVRRRWLNIDKVLEECNDSFRTSKIVCVEVNLENEYSNPLNQVLMHAVLDMLIGIHGAGLVESMWMPTNSFIVELLPYIPPNISWGSWARLTTTPTPLGVIWIGTDLNHIGYPLSRESVPICLNETTTECFEREGFNFQETDVAIPSSVIKKTIKRFLLPHTSSTVPCNDLKARAGSSFVLYNVQCNDGEGQNNTNSPHSFFRKMKSTN